MQEENGDWKSFHNRVIRQLSVFATPPRPYLGTQKLTGLRVHFEGKYEELRA